MTSRELAVKFWFHTAMHATLDAVIKGKYKELTIKEENGLLVVRGPATEGMKEILGAESLPVVMS